MAEKLKEIYAKVMEWWNRFTSRQKTIIIGISGVVVFTFAILIYIFSKPQFAHLITLDNTADAAEVVEILESAGYQHQEKQDGLYVEVLESQKSNANLALASAGFVPNDFTPDDALGGGFSTTDSDKQKKWGVYLQHELEKTLETYTNVKSARAHLNIAKQDGTLIAEKEESSAFIQLELNGEMTPDNAAALAKAVATFLRNETTNEITIMDTEGNLLFAGEEDYTSAGIASSMLELRSQAERMVASQVQKVLLGTNLFDKVEVAPQLDVDYSNYKRIVNEYYPPDGREDGMKSYDEIHESENSGSSGGVPGADSNDETTEMWQDNNISESSTSDRITEYQNNNSMEETITPAGGVNYDNSSLSATLISFNVIKEEDARAQGLLDGVTWEEYKASVPKSTKQEVDPDFYSLVATATGISQDKITIVAYEEPVFLDREGMALSTTDILSIVMLVLILGLLAFVVLRSMRSKRAVEETEELSVENLLQSTPESELEDIDVDAKSETRKLIEKFVDDNPEAAANLLRNWLNEDWG